MQHERSWIAKKSAVESKSPPDSPRTMAPGVEALEGMKMISDKQIEALKNEAAVAGDLAMVRTCDRALDGDESALRDCARVIADAVSMAD